MIFSIVIPIYNEQENIKLLIDEIKNAIPYSDHEYEIIIVDDGSKDNSLNIIKKLITNNILFISNRKNLGQSYSIKIGIEKSSTNTIVTIDGDLQNNPKDIPLMLHTYFKNNLHFLGGIRTKRKDSVSKKFASLLANNIRKKILNDDCDDTGCGLKIFEKNIFLNFPFFDGIHRYLPALFKASNSNISYIDVDHRKRYMGNSKYGNFKRFLWGIRDIIKVMQIIKQIKKNA